MQHRCQYKTVPLYQSWNIILSVSIPNPKTDCAVVDMLNDQDLCLQDVLSLQVAHTGFILRKVIESLNC